MSIDYFHYCKVITLDENYILNLSLFLKQNNYSSTAFLRIKTNHLLVKAEINDVEGLFILDNGASNSCVDLKKSNIFNLKYTESDEKASSATEQISATMVSKKNKILIGKWLNKNVSIVLFDMTFINKTLSEHGDHEVCGIIGGDLLKKGKAIIDYSSNKLFLKL